VSKTFADLGLPKELVSPLRKAGITEPFPIQAATIPDALAGRDVLGRAPTGSGKTLAFGLPLLATLKKAAPRRPTALVLSPTRELAEQIRKELAPIAAGRGLRLVTVYGGVSYHPQRSKLRNGADILIACPGRLQDLIEQGDVSLQDAAYVVVDEADRMADMGFMPQVRKLLDMTPDSRQTLLFSATLDNDVAQLTQRYQTDPVRHDVGGDAHDSGTARHHFWRIEHTERLDIVADVAAAFRSTLVFTRTRRGADRLARQLNQHGVNAEAIHGGRSQRQRDRALRNFRAGHVEALIATDVAARGIHVDGVECVLHFDPPEDHKAYLHRSGRTARAGAGGHVVSLVQHDQVRSARRLQAHLGLRDAVRAPSVDALLNDEGELLGKRASSSHEAERPQNSGSDQRRGRSGQQRNSSGDRSGRRTSRSRSGRSQRDGDRQNGGRSRSSAASGGQRRSDGGTSGRTGQTGDGSGRTARAGGSNGRKASGSNGGSRRRKPNSSGGRYQAAASARSGGSGRRNGGDGRRNGGGDRQNGGGDRQNGGGGNQQRRRKPSGNRSNG